MADAGGAGTAADQQQSAQEQEKEKHELVKLLIARKADCTKQNANGETPLIKAVKKKYKTICQLIINEDCALNALDHNKNTALFYSVRDKDQDIVDVLLGINPHIKSLKNVPNMALTFAEEEYTYLHYAAWYRSPAICKALIRRKANVNVFGKDNHTPLSLACRSNHPRDQIINILLKSGANVNTEDKYKNTPLHYAAFNGNFKAVEELVKRGANIDARNIEGATALWNAVYHKHEDIVELLLDKIADYNVKSRGLSTVKFTDITGRYYPGEAKSAFYVACEKSEQGNTPTENIVKMLVAAGINLEAEAWFWGVDSNGGPRERPANLQNNRDLIDWLIKQGTAIRSLQEFCGLAIRRHYGTNLDLMYAQNPNVPFKIKEFVFMPIRRRLQLMNERS